MKKTAFLSLLALCAVFSAFADVIVPDNPVSILPPGSFLVTQATNLHEGNGSALFDGKTSTRWIVKPKPNPDSGVIPTIAVHLLNGGVAVNAYRLSGYTSESNGARFPKAFKLFGSNDGENWTLLDERPSETGWTKAEQREYIFTNVVAYTDFKFEVHANNGDATYTVLGELELFNFERTDVLEISAAGWLVGAPTPAYGGITGLENGTTLTLDCAETRVNDVDTGDYYTLQGFTLTDFEGTVLASGTPADLPYAYTHSGRYARMTWNWKSHLDEMAATATDDITVPENAEKNMISARSTSSSFASEVPSHVFDNSLSTRWLADAITAASGPNWIQYRFLDGARIVTGLKMNMKTGDATSRLPLDFTFQGSNDGVTFVDLLSVTGAGKTAESPENKVYTFNNATPYEYYRLYMTKSNDSRLLELGEMEFYSIYQPDSIRVVGAPKSYGHPTPDYGFQTNLGDGATYTFSAPTEEIAVSDDLRTQCVGYTLSVNGVAQQPVLATACSYTHSAGDYAVLTWNFADTFRQQFSAIGGSVDVSECWAAVGETVTVTASASDSRTPFVGWMGDVPEGQEMNRTITYVADGPRALTAVFAAPLYVSENGNDANNGQSWEAAFATIGRALEVCAPGGNIIVGPGTYTVDAGSLVLSSPLTLGSSDGPSATVIEASAASIEAAAMTNTVVGCLMSVAADVTVSGFTFRGGMSNDGLAAGLRITSGVVSNCVVDSCSALAAGSFGGGVRMDGDGALLDSVVTNCTTTGNGGGLFLIGGTVRGCRFVGNTASGYAGGVLIGGTLPVSFDDCEIDGNTARTAYSDSNFAGGVLVLRELAVNRLKVRDNRGGGIFMVDGASLYDSVISGNGNVQRGGGVYGMSVTVERCMISGNTVSMFGGGAFIEGGLFRNNLVVGNTNTANNATYGGGGLFCRKDVKVVNCTVTENVARRAQGIWIDATPFTLRNSICAGNISYVDGVAVTNLYGWAANSTEIGRMSDQAKSTEFSCVDDEWYLTSSDFADRGNIVANPKLTADFTLKQSSPCVNAGGNAYVEDGETDLAGNPRIRIFGGKPKYDVVDMGCYESPYRMVETLIFFLR